MQEMVMKEDKNSKFLAIRIFTDEFAPFENKHRKIYGIYCTLSNLSKEVFSKCRRLLGIVPEHGI